MKEGRDDFVSSGDSNRLVVRSDSTDARWGGLVNTPTYIHMLLSHQLILAI